MTSSSHPLVRMFVDCMGRISKKCVMCLRVRKQHVILRYKFGTRYMFCVETRSDFEVKESVGILTAVSKRSIQQWHDSAVARFNSANNRSLFLHIYTYIRT